MKILIIRLGSHGDVVLTTPVIKVLKDRYPAAVIDFLVKKEYRDLLGGNPHLNRIITLDSRGNHKGLKGLLGITGELRKEGYTHIIDLHGNLRSRMVCGLLPGSKTLRYDKQALKRRLLLSGFKVNTRHTVDAYLAALNLLDINVGVSLTPAIYLSEEEKQEAERFLEGNGINKVAAGLKSTPIIIGLAPGARWPTKRWLEEGFVEIGKRAINEVGAKVLVFGGPDEKELCERIAVGIGKEALSVAGKSGLKETAALISRCDVFVSNDSGPMHIATAVGAPVVAIFGPTVQGFGFSPLGKSIVVEKELRCRPCSLHGSERCPKGHFECMRGIKADEVFEKVAAFLNR